MPDQTRVVAMPAEYAYLESLKTALFERLDQDMGFKKPDHFRIPNLGDGVEKDGVEIRTIEKSFGWIEVLIVLPVNAREVSYFKKRTDGGLCYLAATTYVNIRTIDDIDKTIEGIKRIAQHGMSIVFFNRAKMIDCNWHPEDAMPQDREQPTRKKLTPREAAFLGMIFGGTLGMASGWENLKEFTDLLAEHDILQINETIRAAIQKFAEMEVNAFDPLNKLFWRSTLAMMLGVVSQTIFWTGSKIAEIRNKARKN